MSTYTEEVGNKLNELLEKTYDAEKGFKKAAENTENKQLKSFFEIKAKQRYDFGHELKAEIKTFGQNVDKGDSMAGKAHRAWMDVKALFSLDNAEAMLEEANRGEKAAIEEYNDVLEDTSLPSTTATILRSHKVAIENSLSNIKILENVR
ncbi:PA2169 family four-helix-bundle protein [Maribacter sp. Asnod1-A12]|uniref:ferritin-like domain-containing protein n=1 Tax=Maribacter sp. Asnod1-A12 TaxID=3160576 RepID=UPI003865DF86